MLQFRLSGAALEEGDTITITYGDTSGGGPGFALQETSNDQVILHVYADIEGTGDLLRPAWPSFEVLGRDEVRYVNAVAPSIVAPGEPFTLAVRAEDRLKNLSSGVMPALEVLLDGEPFRTIEAGSPAITLLENVNFAAPGVYRFSVQNEDGSIRATSNPVRVEDDPAHRVYWGETHGHTAFAEGQGSPDGYYRFGRDVARLDFLSLSEHDIWMDDSEWRKLQELVEEYRIEGEFTTILGFEWTSRSPLGGHHNVFFRDTPGRSRVPNQKAPLLDELYAGLRDRNSNDDVLVIPHAHQPGDWTNSDPDLERLVEIQSGHGTFDWFGNKYLQNGFEVGFIGASDNHNGHPGYSGAGNRQLGGLAAVYAPENNAECHLQRASRPGRLCDDRRADPPRGDSQRRPHGHAPGGRHRAPDRLPGERHGPDRRDRRDQERRDRLHQEIPGERSVGGRRGCRSPSSRRPRSTASARPHAAADRGGERSTSPEPSSSTTTIPGSRSPRPGEPPATRKTPTGSTSTSRPVGVRSHSFSSCAAQAPTRSSPSTWRRRPSPAARAAMCAVPQELPANTVRFRLGDLKGQVERREYQVLEHTDALSAQIVTEGRALDQEFSFTDQGEVRPGDYYYVRVRQIDGSMAWSSPFWVGESSG